MLCCNAAFIVSVPQRSADKPTESVHRVVIMMHFSLSNDVTVVLSVIAPVDTRNKPVLHQMLPNEPCCFSYIVKSIHILGYENPA